MTIDPGDYCGHYVRVARQGPCQHQLPRPRVKEYRIPTLSSHKSRDSRPWTWRVAAAWGERFWFQLNKGRLHFTFVSPDYKFPVKTSEGSKNCNETRRSQDESRHEARVVSSHDLRRSVADTGRITHTRHTEHLLSLRSYGRCVLITMLWPGCGVRSLLSFLAMTHVLVPACT